MKHAGIANRVFCCLPLFVSRAFVSSLLFPPSLPTMHQKIIINARLFECNTKKTISRVHTRYFIVLLFFCLPHSPFLISSFPPCLTMIYIFSSLLVEWWKLHNGTVFVRIVLTKSLEIYSWRGDDTKANNELLSPSSSLWIDPRTHKWMGSTVSQRNERVDRRKDTLECM